MAEHDLFPSNSNKSRDERSLKERPHGRFKAKPVDKKEETGIQKFVHLFIADDTDDIWSYLLEDLIVPAVRDTWMSFWDAFLWGNRRVGGTKSYHDRRNTDYNKASTSGYSRSRRTERENDQQEKAKFNLNNLIFGSKAQADEILEDMDRALEQYGQVTVGFLYEEIGISGGDWTIETYGWKSLRSARVYRVSSGYFLELPRPIRLE